MLEAEREEKFIVAHVGGEDDDWIDPATLKNNLNDKLVSMDVYVTTIIHLLKQTIQLQNNGYRRWKGSGWCGGASDHVNTSCVDNRKEGQ